jgi:large subunit ribosomal protein L19e
MKLEKKKELAARTLGVGKKRILFNMKSLASVKEAITKQDIRDLVQGGAISIKEIGGRKKVEKRKLRRRGGSVRKKVRGTKREYIILTRKLRSYLFQLRARKLIAKDKYVMLRKEIKMKSFRSLAHMKERIKEMQKHD